MILPKENVLGCPESSERAGRLPFWQGFPASDLSPVMKRQTAASFSLVISKPSTPRICFLYKIIRRWYALNTTSIYLKRQLRPAERNQIQGCSRCPLVSIRGSRVCVTWNRVNINHGSASGCEHSKPILYKSYIRSQKTSMIVNRTCRKHATDVILLSNCQSSRNHRRDYWNFRQASM